MSEAGGSAKLLVCASLVLLVYFIVGVVFFVQTEKVLDADDGKMRPMRPIEGIYFVVCTFSTVGYGIPAPTTDTGKLFTVFFSLLGVGLISIAVAIAMAFLMDRKNAMKLKETVRNPRPLLPAPLPPPPALRLAHRTFTIQRRTPGARRRGRYNPEKGE